jgi:hypothetical protein
MLTLARTCTHAHTHGVDSKFMSVRGCMPCKIRSPHLPLHLTPINAGVFILVFMVLAVLQGRHNRFVFLAQEFVG